MTGHDPGTRLSFAFTSFFIALRGFLRRNIIFAGGLLLLGFGLVQGGAAFD